MAPPYPAFVTVSMDEATGAWTKLPYAFDFFTLIDAWKPTMPGV